MRAERPRESFASTVVGAAIVVAIVMTAYEATKEAVAPGLTKWQSHMITIAMTTALAAAAGGVVARAQQRASQRLRRNEEDLRITLAAIGDAVIATDRDGRITRMNAVAARLTGWPVDEAIGRPVQEVLRMVDAATRERVDPFPEVMATGEVRTLSGTTLLVARAGGERVVADSAAPIRSGLGNVVGVVLVFRDTTSEHRLRQQLSQIQRMESVGRLAGGVAHDFNNLLTVIISLVTLMEDASRNERDAGDLAQIRAAAEHAAELTRQLLAFARRQVIEPREVDLNQVVGKVDRMLRRLIGEDVELSVMLAGDLGVIRADPAQVEQVIMNLAVNAREAMDGGGKLTIETENARLDRDYALTHPEVTPGQYVMMRVTDTGTGMSRETMEHIFEPFFTTKAAGTGTGLGLATCYGIVKQSGGSIAVSSEPGKGTTFRVFFPRVKPESVAGKKTPPALSAGGHESLLLVEDDERVRRIAVRVLAGQGYQVTEAVDGVDALARFDERGGAFDLVVTDVVMPRMGGKELVDRLRERRPDLKVLFTSGYTGDAIAKHGVLVAGVNLLAKPYLPPELLRCVREVLDRG
jgi:PAS domain S-box-containing protein